MAADLTYYTIDDLRLGQRRLGRLGRDKRLDLVFLYQLAVPARLGDAA